jgi:hypothetical protein
MFYFIFGVLLWIFGYIAGRIRPGSIRFRNRPMENNINVVYVKPPFILYLLCGLPKFPHLPSGVMGYYNLYGQLLGLLWVAYEVIFKKWPYTLDTPKDLLALVIAFLITTIIMIFIETKMKYKTG